MPGERPLRVALLEPAGRGGICHYTRALASALAKQGVDVLLVTAREYEFAAGDDGSAAANNGMGAPPFQVVRLFARRRTSLRQLLRVLRDFAPDLLHLQSGTHPALHLGLLLAARAATGARVLVTAHDVVPKNAGRLDVFFSSLLYRAADRIVVHGRALAEEMARRFPATGDKVAVVPHGEYGYLAEGPAASTASATARNAGTPDAVPTLLFFGYLHQEKGLPDLIEALPAVIARVPKLELVIAGKPEFDLQPLMLRATTLGVASQVTWQLGYVPADEMRSLFEAARVVVLPYRNASQSGVVFLAGAFARPVVATRVGALPEVIEEGETGLLVPPGDPEALGEALARLLSDPVLARKMGERHALRCRSEGSWDGIAARTVALYEEMRKERAVPRLVAMHAGGSPTAAHEASPRTVPSQLDNAPPFVSVLMPVRNEEAAITSCLESLLAQDYPADRFEVVVMDGRSTDRTREQVRELCRRDPRLRLFDNPGLVVSTALNLGFAKVHGSLVARADGHSRYASDYLRAAVRAVRESQADVVGGPMLAAGGATRFQRAVARALASRFGMGGAAFHFDGFTGPAEAVYLGVYRADALLRFGPFDEHLVRDEDDEWFARARRRGAKVYLDARIRSTYQPRASPRLLLRQYFGYGLFKPAALRKVAGSWRLRHLAPSTFLLALLLPLLFGWPWISAAMAAVYALASSVASACAVRDRNSGTGEPGEGLLHSGCRVAAVFALMHLGYGVGFLAGLVRRGSDDSRSGLRAVYAGYANDPRKRRAWSATEPGQVRIVGERDHALARKLRERFGARTSELRILDLGSGERDLAAALATEEVRPRLVVASDLLRERLAGNPHSSRIVTDGRLLPFADGSFDVVVQCTLFSSLRAQAGRRVVAAEMLRVCRPDGLVLSYDARLPNPFNHHVRRLARREHAGLFAGCPITFQSLTLMPPIARLLPTFATQLARFAPLRAFDLAAIDPTPRATSLLERP